MMLLSRQKYAICDCNDSSIVDASDDSKQKKKTLQITFIVHFRKCYTLKPLDCYHDETKFVFYGFVISHLSSTTHIQHK